MLEKVSRQLAEHFPPGTVSAQIASAREAVAAHPKVVELRARLAAGQARAEEAWHELQQHLPHLPQLPSVAELKARALQKYADSPSTDEIVARARQMIAERFSFELFPELRPAMA